MSFQDKRKLFRAQYGTKFFGARKKKLGLHDYVVGAYAIVIDFMGERQRELFIPSHTLRSAAELALTSSAR
jgi:hypothetical protein